MSQVVSAEALLGTLGIDMASATPAAAAVAATPTAAAPAASAAAAAPSDADVDADVNESAMERDLRALFDARRPFRALTQGASAPVLQRSLNAELTCPVCLGIIRDCTAVMECLHRFCAACIEKSLRFGKKECPSCRVTVASRRNLRKDDAFNAVIAAIYPDPAQAEAAHESYIQDVIKSYNVRKFGTIASKGSRQQKDHARKSTKRPASPPPSSGMDGATGGPPMAKRPRNPSKPEPISFSIVQHPALAAAAGDLAASMRLKNKFVRTSRYITVLLLKKWLQLKLLTPKTEVASVPAAKAETEAEVKTDGAAAKAEGVDAKTEGDASAPAAAATEGSVEPKGEQAEAAATAAAPASADAGSVATSGAAAASDAKMEDTAAVAAAGGASPSPAAVVPALPGVRFVLYVRAFDTSLLDPSDPVGESGTGIGSVAGEETFVPLASDLTLDYIEEHMWCSEGRAADRQAAAINAELARAAAAAEGPDADPTALLQRAFRQSFAVCSTHRKLKARCTEDCTDRVAAWHDFCARESEKFNKYRAKLKEQQQQQQAATAAGAAAAANGAAGAAADAAATSAAALGAPSSVPAHPAFIALPHKKRRLVLYYSVVGPDGQLLLDSPVLAPNIVSRFVIRDEDEEAEGEGEGEADGAADAGADGQAQEDTAVVTAGAPLDAEAAQTDLMASTESQDSADAAAAAAAAPLAADEPTAMQLDDSNDVPAADAATDAAMAV